jgi:O-antigen ligase
MNFALFLLLNAVLLIRPEELLPDIAGLRLYLIVMALCLVASAPGLVRQLTLQSLVENPITVCVLGLLAAVLTSLVFRGMIGYGLDVAGEFAKVVLYYLLFLAVVDTPRRFRLFLGAIVALAVVLTTLSLLQYHEYIDVEALRPLERRADVDPETGEAATFTQLRASGIYNDPNDFCLLLTTGIVCCLGLAATSASVPVRLAWLCPIGVFGYAIVLTQSRGGLLGLLVAIFTLLCMKLGPRRGAILGAICLPLLVLAIGGRQADINTSVDDTAQSRFQLWAEGLTLLWQNPITGIGAGEFVEEVGQVAHNSFVQAYVETGLFGGTLFLCAFVFAAVGVLLIPRQPTFANRSATIRGLQPFVVAMVVGYAAGLYSLTRNMVVPTYMTLALAATYTRIALPSVPDAYRLSPVRLRQMLVFGFAGLVFLKLFTQSMVQFGR